MSLPLGSLGGNHLGVGFIGLGVGVIDLGVKVTLFGFSIWRLSCMGLSPPSSLPLPATESNRSFDLLATIDLLRFSFNLFLDRRTHHHSFHKVGLS